MIDYKSFIKNDVNCIILPIESRQCFVYNNAGTLLGCIVLGDLTHYLGTEQGSALVWAHDVQICDIAEMDDILCEWDYKQSTEVTAKDYLKVMAINC